MSYQKVQTKKEIEVKLVDVFSSKPFEGNPLLVVLYGENLSDEKKIAVIKEMNRKKGVFLSEADDGKSDFKIQVFNHQGPIEYDYHCLLGAAYVMIKEKKIILKKGTTNIITVQTRNDVLPLIIQTQRRELQKIMVMVSWEEKPEFRRIDYDTAMVAQSLGIDSEDIRTDILMHAVKMTDWSIIIPVKSPEILTKVQVNPSKFIKLAQDNNIEFICLCYIDPTSSDEAIPTRIFAPMIEDMTQQHHIEDQITGRSNIEIAAYLFENKLLKQTGSKFMTEFVQETVKNRKGNVFVEMAIINDSIREISIGGIASIILEGKMKVTSF
ncbi:MAG: PhzF family phenazine biosynthesis isomerase [Asgard group archaeon]|nr:PhzF family phenazine biosynthesis isomerase [Asgard group archaeon]